MNKIEEIESLLESWKTERDYYFAKGDMIKTLIVIQRIEGLETALAIINKPLGGK